MSTHDFNFRLNKLIAAAEAGELPANEQRDMTVPLYEFPDGKPIRKKDVVEEAMTPHLDIEDIVEEEPAPLLEEFEEVEVEPEPVEEVIEQSPTGQAVVHDAIEENVEEVIPAPALEEIKKENEHLPPVDPEWAKCNGLDDTDAMVRSWTTYNRKIAYLYPKVILPGMRRPLPGQKQTRG